MLGTKKARRMAPKKTPFITHRVPVLKRRTFLRSAVGAAVALPWLEIMVAPNAKAQSQPFRYLVSTGRHFTAWIQATACRPRARSRSCRSSTSPSPRSNPRSVWSTALTIPQGPRDNLPPGGTKTSPGHYGGWAAMVTGTRGTGTGNASGPSSDYIVAEAIGGQTPFDVLRYQAQPSPYAGGGSSDGGRTGRAAESTRSRAPVSRMISCSPASTPAQPLRLPHQDRCRVRASMKAAACSMRVSRRNTLIDSVLGAADRRRLEAHFEEVRNLERRISDLPTIGGTGTTSPAGPICRMRAAPGPRGGSGHRQRDRLFERRPPK